MLESHGGLPELRMSCFSGGLRAICLIEKKNGHDESRNVGEKIDKAIEGYQN